MRVNNWHNWQRAKAISAGVLVISAIGLIGGLEGTEPLPSTAPWGLLCVGGAYFLLSNVFKHDKRLNPQRYVVKEEEWQ